MIPNDSSDIYLGTFVFINTNISYKGFEELQAYSITGTVFIWDYHLEVKIYLFINFLTT